jgi:hypothetical protein
LEQTLEPTKPVLAVRLSSADSTVPGNLPCKLKQIGSSNTPAIDAKAFALARNGLLPVQNEDFTAKH